MDTETALSILAEDYDESLYKILEFWENEGHFKHDLTKCRSIVKRKSDNTFWKISFIFSYEYGLDKCSVEAYEVEKKAVTTYQWVPKGIGASNGYK